jgi:aminoglycoside phosphotransferase (APT) family kinase protein
MTSISAEAVSLVLATVLPAPVTVADLHPLSGGASADTWSCDATDAGGTRHALVLRRNAGRGGISLGLDPRLEPLVQRAAAAFSVPTPEVLAIFDDASLGAGYVMRRLTGETIPRRLLRKTHPALASQVAAALAAVHAVPPDSLPDMPVLPAVDQLPVLESLHRSIGHAIPTFELALRWLADNLPATPEISLVHGDFRIGNFIVDEEGLVAVLDWELSHLGDPMEDLGWLCTRAWRFGGPGEVGGFASRQAFYAAYEAEAGVSLDPAVIHFWEVLGALKWGIICQLQAAVHLRGEPSVERAAIGRRVTETELDLLLLLESAHA